jgi:hypothetical protein
MWRKIPENYLRKWRFPNCRGALGGRHVEVKCPANSLSLYYKYKHNFLILIIALVDANCKLILVDIEAVWRWGNFQTILII